MAQLPRGIAPELLVSQVKNTMPYLFGTEGGEGVLGAFEPTQVLRSHDARSSEPLTHHEYFRLCLCSHYLSCATPVPTDVDNQIRQKLWPAQLPEDTAIQMAKLVLESRKWDFTVVTARFVAGAPGTPWQDQVLSGHLGEWFTVAAGAYCALGRYSESAPQSVRAQLFDAIADEVSRHAEVFGSLWREKEGVACLKAAASIAHNLGDLDRVMDMWDLSVADPLRLRFYKLASVPFDAERKLRYLGRLWVAGELYKAVMDRSSGSSMAHENHRHFALRKPRSLRQSPDLLIPTGPFFDDWGRKVARALSSDGEATEQTLEVIDALVQGWARLPKTVGYGRALRGMLEVHPRLDLGSLKGEHAVRATLDMAQERFERKWAEHALAEMEDIPSRA